MPLSRGPVPEKARSLDFLGREEGNQGAERGRDWPEVTQPSVLPRCPPAPAFRGSSAQQSRRGFPGVCAGQSRMMKGGPGQTHLPP